jgi:hypothetical protein
VFFSVQFSITSSCLLELDDVRDDWEDIVGAAVALSLLGTVSLQSTTLMIDRELNRAIANNNSSFRCEQF